MKRYSLTGPKDGRVFGYAPKDFKNAADFKDGRGFFGIASVKSVESVAF